MSTDRDVTRIVRSWMDEGVTALPDRVLDAVLDQVPATPQRRATWWPVRRLQTMNNATRLGIVAAVVAIAAVLGYSYFVAPNVGSDRNDQPTPSVHPSPPPTSASIFGTTDLAPGTYLIEDPFPVQFEVTIPEGWETWGTDGSIVRIWKPCVDSGCQGFSAILDFEIVRATLDPCQGHISSEFGETVDALVNDITGLPGFEAGTVTDVSVDGSAGRAFDLQFVGPIEPTCDEEAPWQWFSNTRVTWGPDARQRVIVLDADGTRLVIDEITYFGDRREMDAIVETIDFH